MSVSQGPSTAQNSHREIALYNDDSAWNCQLSSRLKSIFGPAKSAKHTCCTQDSPVHWVHLVKVFSFQVTQICRSRVSGIQTRQVGQI